MSTAPVVPIYQGQDFYVPYFELKVNGQAQGLGVVRDILQVSYKDSISEIDSFEVSVNNWDAEKRAYKYSDADTFDPGKDLELWMGYYGGNRLKLMIKGQITSLRPAFPSGAPSTLSVAGLNILHKLRREQRSAVYENLTDSEIARQIGSRLQVEVETDPSPDEQPYPYLFQENQYDIIFLMERARRIGYEIFVDERSQNGQARQTVLRFGKSTSIRRTTYGLTYGRSLVEFSPELTTANQVAEVTVRGWDAVRKQKIEVTVNRSQIQTRGVGSQGNQQAIEQAFNQKREVITNRPIASETEARNLALQVLETNAKDMVTATGSTVGLPDLRAGCTVEIDGVGTRFTGKYFITGTTHAIADGGYTTQFECRREEV